MTPPPVWETGSEQIAYLTQLARRIGGFDLEKERSLLSDPRVMDLLFREKAGTIEELVARLQRTTEGSLHINVVESLAVSDTAFFRDCKTFELIEQKIIPSIVEARGRRGRLRLWSAGCSTGQEAYSLAIAADRALGAKSDGWKVLGTDLCARNIRIAEGGIYSQYDINCGLPAHRLVEYFEKKEGQWRVKPALKKQVSFRKLNLVDSYESYPECELVLMRYVLRYFDPARRREVLAKVRRCLTPGGLMVMGCEETALPEDGFEPVQFGKCTAFRPV